LCLDLTINIDQLQILSEADLLAELSKKPFPIRKIRTNAAPVLCPLWDAPETLFRQDHVERIETVANRVSQDQTLKSKLLKAYEESRQPFAEPRSVEEMIYAGFPSRSDEATAASFHRAPWNERPGIVQSLDDARLQEFGLRLFGYEARSTVSRQLVDRADRSIANSLIDQTTGRLTLSECLDEVGKLLLDGQIDHDGHRLLTDFQQYLSHRISRVAQFQASTSSV
jgi:exodeoxyribonuclease-1